MRRWLRLSSILLNTGEGLAHRRTEQPVAYSGSLIRRKSCHSIASHQNRGAASAPKEYQHSPTEMYGIWVQRRLKPTVVPPATVTRACIVSCPSPSFGLTASCSTHYWSPAGSLQEFSPRPKSAPLRS